MNYTPTGKTIDIYLVYLLSGALSGYVGWTSKTPEHRLSGHIRGARRGARYHISSALRKHDFQVGVRSIEQLTDHDDFLSAERRWIQHYRNLGWNLWNETEGGEGMLGFVSHLKGTRLPQSWRDKISKSHLGKKQSEAHRLANSLSHKGQVSWLKGKHHTEEAKEKNRQKHLGKIASLATRQKLSEALTGRRPSQESIEKMKEGLRAFYRTHPHPGAGKRPWNYNKPMKPWSTETRARHEAADERRRCKQALLYNVFI